MAVKRFSCGVAATRHPSAFAQARSASLPVRHLNIVRLLGWAANRRTRLLFSTTSRTSPSAAAAHRGGSTGEYGCMTKITMKSDVYSFGVVLLEAITGRRPMEAAFGEGRSVVQWVREHLHQKRDPAEVIDQRLQGRPDTQVQEMLQALGIALLCAGARPEDWPTMKDVAALLRGLWSDDGAEARKVSGGGGGGCGAGARPLDSARWAAAASSLAKPTAQAQSQSTSSSLAYSM
ncbi:unnamed protein product [Miscanthus lutarioriparius]|uniref:Serine-threonine/tyrosine-protein kinase catalytic domain-containing protein n=1 Tax=Miscanthus lutarioriparius TaxID=422564 RepID=A0A811PV53_9POAL|nr:unnamed protein product [Miscanthus lutarioriparius]